jgi:hypothetical protein
MPNGDGGGGFDFGGLFDALLGELGALIQAILQFLQDLVIVLVNALNFLFAGEQGIFSFSFAGLTDILKGLVHILDRVFKAVVLGALHHLWDLFTKLQAFVRKLKQWLDRFHQLQRQYQIKAFRRVINLIQRIRKILVIFRVLHLKFAQKLDQFLSHVEAVIVQRQLDIARKDNTIIGWMNVILDPSGILRHIQTMGSIGHSLGDMLGALGALGITKVFPQLAQVVGANVPQRPWSAVRAQFRQESSTNTGDYGGFKQQSAYLRGLFDQGTAGNG